MSARDRLRANDARFHELAAGFSAAEWARPSLCEHWSNHDVLAHLVVGHSASSATVISEMLRHRGSFDRANAAMARSLAAARTPAELLDDFQRLTQRPHGLGRYFPSPLLLGDHVTHELDILFALGREPVIPADALVAVLETQVRVPNPFVPAYANGRGLRLAATDVGWTYGDRGPVVRGRAAELVSVLGNRPAMLSRLDGDGVDVLTSRVSRHLSHKDG
ncbi:hypothetical protein A5724_04610 [Mycobacterium sp. ACS1612]|uniref:maleylpyruvate isomerase family mycothiol-dependent enzyme n=1 Tax=Mycobacterium sp. ACS1612 TaxID=1834117 RepID=UPI0007FF40A7|nr:maleylpyruvate isomerase family mycothiol-dependent enzyme [Mycobacterium sp. ACS1612]OBF41796.1 hypothetical protein A5724_04610 [Mycobacterium sp. ACS1612]